MPVGCSTKQRCTAVPVGCHCLDLVLWDVGDQKAQACHMSLVCCKHQRCHTAAFLGSPDLVLWDVEVTRGPRHVEDAVSPCCPRPEAAAMGCRPAEDQGTMLPELRQSALYHGHWRLQAPDQGCPPCIVHAVWDHAAATMSAVQPISAASAAVFGTPQDGSCPASASHSATRSRAVQRPPVSKGVRGVSVQNLPRIRITAFRWKGPTRGRRLFHCALHTPPMDAAAPGASPSPSSMPQYELQSYWVSIAPWRGGEGGGHAARPGHWDRKTKITRSDASLDQRSHVPSGRPVSDDQRTAGITASSCHTNVSVRA
jgi:hypothetical protein